MINQKLNNVDLAMFMRTARYSINLTQEQMAKKLGISRSQLSLIEKGKLAVTLEFAKKIAKLTGMSTQYATTLCLQDIIKRAKEKYQINLSEKN
jgi:transcriptional regulator with XRE-family HTH domain